jgi:hypothetical protein
VVFGLFRVVRFFLAELAHHFYRQRFPLGDSQFLLRAECAGQRFSAGFLSARRWLALLRFFCPVLWFLRESIALPGFYFCGRVVSASGAVVCCPLVLEPRETARRLIFLCRCMLLRVGSFLSWSPEQATAPETEFSHRFFPAHRQDLSSPIRFAQILLTTPRDLSSTSK